MKVPLGPHFDKIAENDRFTVQDAMLMAKSMLKDVYVDVPVEEDPSKPPTMQRRPAVANMVIDLTNSSRYYRRETFEQVTTYKGEEVGGYLHVKIPNKGRGEVPAPQAVNDFVFEAFSHLNRCPEAYILVHCTHGFNRTGFMICSYLMRVLADPTTRLTNVLRMFTEARPPGIYKDYYIKYLFKYYHEKTPRDMPTPSLPPWKPKGAHEGEDDDVALLELEENPLFDTAVGRGYQHDDPMGEPVSKTEGDWVRGLLMQCIMNREVTNSHACMFPGSQPVSLERENLSLLATHRYWVTWKADGTRYLMFLHPLGTYLIDRSNAVTRVQMRWPRGAPKWEKGHPPPVAPVGPFHVGTMLDGEMVVDIDRITGLCTRRFLAYDLMVLNGMSGVAEPWHSRWAGIKRYVEEPRHFEQSEAAKGKWKLLYDYASEPFRFRRKDFWPLSVARKVAQDFIPKMSHEVDGLILQPADDPYVPLTCRELLKWKFASHNSVDFKGRWDDGEQKMKLLLLVPKGQGNTATLEELKDKHAIFPSEQQDDPLQYAASFNGKILECRWNFEQRVWEFMRVRLDKNLPNAWGVYQSVWKSIEDDITMDELLQVIDKDVQLPVYAADHRPGAG